MKYVYWILAFSLLFSVPALAQIDPNPDGIGIYADLDGMTNRISLEPNTPLEVYLLLTRPSAEGMLGGWDCSLIVPDNVYVWGFNYPVEGSVAVLNGNNFAVGFPCIDFQTVNLLATFIIMPLDGKCAYFYIGPWQVGSQEPPYPRYLVLGADGTPTDELVDMNPYPGGLTEPCFAVNETELATDTVSFGQVKALYR